MFNLGIDIAKKGHVAAVVDQNGKLLVASFKFTIVNVIIFVT